MDAKQIADTISLDPKGSVFQTDFCKAWPKVRQALEWLKDIVNNAIAKGAISLVITAGDAVQSKVCGAPEPTPGATTK